MFSDAIDPISVLAGNEYVGSWDQKISLNIAVLGYAPMYHDISGRRINGGVFLLHAVLYP
jgi:hypothetical protein